MLQLLFVFQKCSQLKRKCFLKIDRSNNTSIKFTSYDDLNHILNWSKIKTCKSLFFYFFFRPLTAEEIALRREKIRMRAAAKSVEDDENEKDQDNLSKFDESDGLLLYIKSV